jgi:3-phenylpropionate/trans-cinnamate dioxygenase ferredoxin component
MSEEKTLVRLCGVDEVPLDEARRFEVNGHRIALFHLPLGFFALGDTCSHAEASLSEGYIEDDSVECPEHGAQFDITTGETRSLPATKPVPTYRVIVEGDEVFVEDPNG